MPLFFDSRATVSLPSAVVCTVLLFLTALAQAAPSLAHQSSHSRIDQLNFQIALVPGSARLHLKRSELYLDIQHWDEARTDLLRAAALDPRSQQIPWLLARVHLQAGEPQAAVELLDSFLEDSPSHLRALILRAQAHRALARPLAAAGDYEAALAIAPDSGPTFYLELADCYAEATPARLEEASRVLERGLLKVGSLLSLETRAVRLEIERGLYDEGLIRVDRVLERLPRAWSWHATRAELLTHLGRRQEARTASLAALEILEADPERLHKSPVRSARADELRRKLAESDATVTPTVTPTLAGRL